MLLRMRRSGHIVAACLPALLLLLVGGTEVRSAVYRCDGPGAITFSQFPCPGGDKVIVHPAPAVRVPPLSDAERHRLDDLARRSEAQRIQRTRAAQRSAAAARREREQRRARCASAREAQSDLRRERRKGYSLSEARALERRQADLDAALQRNC